MWMGRLLRYSVMDLHYIHNSSVNSLRNRYSYRVHAAHVLRTLGYFSRISMFKFGKPGERMPPAPTLPTTCSDENLSAAHAE